MWDQYLLPLPSPASPPSRPLRPHPLPGGSNQFRKDKAKATNGMESPSVDVIQQRKLRIVNLCHTWFNRYQLVFLGAGHSQQGLQLLGLNLFNILWICRLPFPHFPHHFLASSWRLPPSLLSNLPRHLGLYHDHRHCQTQILTSRPPLHLNKDMAVRVQGS